MALQVEHSSTTRPSSTPSLDPSSPDLSLLDLSSHNHLLNLTLLHHLEEERKQAMLDPFSPHMVAAQSLEELHYFSQLLPPAKRNITSAKITPQKAAPKIKPPTPAPAPAPILPKKEVQLAPKPEQEPQSEKETVITSELTAITPAISIPDASHTKLFPRKSGFDYPLQIELAKNGVHFLERQASVQRHKNKAPYWIFTTFVTKESPLTLFLTSISQAAQQHLQVSTLLLHLNETHQLGSLAALSIDKATHIFCTAPKVDEEYSKKLLRKLPGFIEESDSIAGISIIGKLNEITLYFLPIDERSPHDVGTKKVIWNFLKSVKMP